MRTQDQATINSDQHLLPTEVSAQSSWLFGRARNYPIFSRAWYRYRSLAILMVSGLLGLVPLIEIGSKLLLDGSSRPAYIFPILIVACYFLIVAIGVVGPGIATFINERSQSRIKRNVAIAGSLLMGIVFNAFMPFIFIKMYEMPYVDAETKNRVYRKASSFQNFLTGPTTIEFGSTVQISREGKPYVPKNFEEAQEYSVLFEKYYEDFYKSHPEIKKPVQPEIQVDLRDLELVQKINTIIHFSFLFVATYFLCWLGGLFDFFTFIRQQKKLTAYQQAQELRRTQAARAEAELRLSVLAAQVEPHFLFNTLASVRSAIVSDQTRATAIVDHLVSYLRSTIPQMRSDAAVMTVKLGTQLNAARAYLALMHERIPRLNFSVFAEPDLENALVPPLMLISLLENAVKHGIEPKLGEAHISVIAQRGERDNAAELIITVSDNGVGFGDATAGSGIGLANIQERLASYYGERASLSLKALPDGGVAATLHLPLEF
jgi:two-component sensor histidine kinase